MKLSRAFAFVVLFLVLMANAEQTVTYERLVRYHEVVSGHSISVVIHRQPYDFSKHVIAGGEGNQGGPATIDGVLVGGTDGLSPKRAPGWPVIETISHIDLVWDGKKIIVPPKLHLNLLNLTLDEGFIQFVPRPSGEELLIQALGGDGGASYGVSLVLRRNGDHKQYLYSHDENLPVAPYEFFEYLGTDKEGNNIGNLITWLEPKAEAPPDKPK
jgi:hypothetical protein